jgi:hypothetical protein
MTLFTPVAIPPAASATDPGWDTVVLRALAEWERAPPPADAGFDPPTAASLAAARAAAASMRDAGEPPPARVVMDGSGGVAFETVVGSALVRRVEVSDAGRVDLYEFDPDGRSMRHTPVGR